MRLVRWLFAGYLLLLATGAILDFLTTWNVIDGLMGLALVALAYWVWPGRTRVAVADARRIMAEGVAKYSNDGFVLESEGPWRSTMVSSDSRLILTIDRRGARHAVREDREG